MIRLISTIKSINLTVKKITLILSMKYLRSCNFYGLVKRELNKKFTGKSTDSNLKPCPYTSFLTDISLSAEKNENEINISQNEFYIIALNSLQPSLSHVIRYFTPCLPFVSCAARVSGYIHHNNNCGDSTFWWGLITACSHVTVHQYHLLPSTMSSCVWEPVYHVI